MTTQHRYIDVHTHLQTSDYFPVHGIALQHIDGITMEEARKLSEFARAITHDPSLDYLSKPLSFNDLADTDAIAEIERHEMPNMDTLRSRLKDLSSDEDAPVDGELKPDRSRSIAITKENVGDYLRYAGLMTTSERNNLLALLGYYAKGAPDDARAPELVVTVAPDFEKAYEKEYGPGLDKPKFKPKQQIDRMAALTKGAQGRVIAFAPLDPFRSQWPQIMDHAMSKGITGFKLYPPMGYCAANIPGYAFKVSGAVTGQITPMNSPEVNDRMAAILERAHSQSLRLIAHCAADGFEVSGPKHTGLYSDPAFWDHAMKIYGLDDLWLMLAHGGGTAAIDHHGWLATDADWPKTFAARAVEMCRQWPNVYIDVAAFSEILEPANRKTYFTRLKSLLLEETATPYQLRDKICFASDWPMPSMVDKPRKVLNRFYKFFDDPQMAPFAAAFFEGNARRFLGLPQATALTA